MKRIAPQPSFVYSMLLCFIVLSLGILPCDGVALNEKSMGSNDKNKKIVDVSSLASALLLHCPKNSAGQVCNGSGTCKSGICVCKPGFTGIDCKSVTFCPKGCSPATGFCHAGRCFCLPGYEGTNCSLSRKTSEKNNLFTLAISIFIAALMFFIGLVIGAFVAWRVQKQRMKDLVHRIMKVPQKEIL